MIVATIALYLALVVGIGLVSHRLFRGTGEDYFLATRTIGPFLLLMSFFGTNMTAFSILGASGEAYRRGIGVFALMASSSALVVPVVILLLGPRLWQLSQRSGFLTQVEFFRKRWGSDRLGLALFVVLVALLIPYLLIGIKGGGLTLNQITGGQVPEWIGSAAMCVVVFTYVTLGGLRGTAWANTFQTLVFMTLGAATFVLIVAKSGGLTQAFSRVAEAAPELLIRGDRITPIELLTYTTVPLSVAMFPHIFMHWLTARSKSAFRLPIVAYPICIAVVWIPSVVIGVLSIADIPGLEGPAANSVLVQMIGLYAPGFMAGLLAAGVFAAVMSSLDSQVLALSTMFTRDIVRHYGFHDAMTGRQQIQAGRIFVGVILGLTLALSLSIDRSIFALGVWSFSGFTALAPLVFAAVYWRRSTRQGAWAALLTATGLWTVFFWRGWSVPGYTPLGSGIMPAAILLVASSAAMVIVSLMTRPPSEDTLTPFFPSDATQGVSVPE